MNESAGKDKAGAASFGDTMLLEVPAAEAYMIRNVARVLGMGEREAAVQCLNLGLDVIRAALKREKEKRTATSPTQPRKP